MLNSLAQRRGAAEFFSLTQRREEDVMDNHLEMEADALAIGFQVGFFGKDDIERWADEQIERIEVPATQLLDLSILRHTPAAEVFQLLRALGSEHAADAYTTKLGFIGELLSLKRIDLETAARMLYEDVLCSVDIEVPSDVEELVYWLGDAYELALSGCGHESLDDVERNAVDFLFPYVVSLRSKHPKLLRICEM